MIGERLPTRSGFALGVSSERFTQLRKPVVKIGRWTRDELYQDKR